MVGWRVWVQKEGRGILVLMNLLTILPWRWINNLHTQSKGTKYHTKMRTSKMKKI